VVDSILGVLQNLSQPTRVHGWLWLPVSRETEIKLIHVSPRLNRRGDCTRREGLAATLRRTRKCGSNTYRVSTSTTIAEDFVKVSVGRVGVVLAWNMRGTLRRSRLCFQEFRPQTRRDPTCALPLWVCKGDAEGARSIYHT